MNRKLIIRMLGALLLIEAAAMAPSLVVSLVYGEGDAAAIGAPVLIHQGSCRDSLQFAVIVIEMQPGL